MRRTILAIVGVLWAGLLYAQPVPPGAKVTLGAANAAAVISVSQDTIVTLQIQGTYTGTISFFGSLDGASYFATNCTPINGTTAVTSATTTGIWSCSMVGINFFQAQMSAYTSGTATVSFATAYLSGSSSGGGGAAGNVSITQGGNTAAVNGSSQLSVNCANCSGSGVSQQDNTGFVPGTTNFVPVGGEVDDVGTTAVAENSAGAARITAQRGVHVNLRTAAGVETGIAAAPLQVSLANTAANATAVKVDGTGGTFPISGSVSGTGNFTVVQPTGTNLHAVIDATSTTAVTQATAANLNATVVGTGTFAVQNTQAGTASQNVAQLAGTATDVNSGNKSAGTLRVVIATDQPALTNKLLVTPDSVALPANQSVNAAQVAGTNTSTGNGVVGAGVQRVAIASDNTTFTTAPAATATTTDGVITTNCYITSAASTNSTNCKASAGNVYFLHVTNTTTTNYFLRLYNSSSAPTCSSATGFVETIPALGAAANGGVNGRVNVIPQSYTTGIGFCLTGGGSSTDNTNAATGVYITIGYK